MDSNKSIRCLDSNGFQIKGFDVQFSKKAYDIEVGNVY